MPKAVTSVQTKRFELQTLPEAYVVLRKLNYGERKKIESMSMKFPVPGPTGEREGMTIDMAAVIKFQFGACIVEHNLEDNDGRTLDFTQEKDFDQLEDFVGEEIEELIAEFNAPEELREGDDPLVDGSGSPSNKGKQKTQR